MAWEIFCIFPFACSSDMTGSSMADREEVTALGKSRKDRDIPVRMPYRLRASVEERPDCRSDRGIRTASTLWSKVRLTRLAVTGMDMVSNVRHR